MLDRLAAQSSTAAGERLKQRHREQRAHLPRLVELADGIYGMNFRHLPELEWTFGYPLVLVVMALICMGCTGGSGAAAGCSRPAVR